MSDVDELNEQVGAGEIDPERAAELRARYLAEAEDLRSGKVTDRPPLEEEPDSRRSWLRPRFLAGGALLLAGVAIAVFAVMQFVESRSDDSATPPIDGDALAGLDLDGISNEDLERQIAANPDAIEMRLALGRRYVNAGEFQNALPHYLTVLQYGDNVEAFAYLGWIEHLSDQSEAGADLVERALEIDGDDPLALAIMAVIRLDGLNDPAGARQILDRLAENPHLPDELRESVAKMRERTETG